MGNHSSAIRIDRIFDMHGKWYFCTREGVEGPFQSRTQAKKKLDVHLDIFGKLELSGGGSKVLRKPRLDLIPTHMQWR